MRTSPLCFLFSALSLLAVSCGPLLAADKGEDMPPPPAWMKIPPAPLVPPKDTLATFQVQKGYQLQLVAAEPLVREPVQILFDAAGRMWVVEMCGYMPNADGTMEDQANGKIIVLEDTDGDGVMDKSTTFLDGLVLPRSMCLVNGGVLVAEPPKIWFCRDTDGDLKCDDKKEVFTGFGTVGNPEHSSNGLLLTLDNWIYSANHAMRYRFFSGKWAEERTASRGQWGIGQDDSGRLYHNSNSDQLRSDLLPADLLLRNPNLRAANALNVQIAKDQSVWSVRVNPGVNRGYQAATLRKQGSTAGVPGSLTSFTAVCAPVPYRGDLMPELSGSIFIAEPAANVVRRSVLKESGYDVTASNAYEQAEFISSTDERFRPVNFANGPDGALYIVDMYKGVLQHRIFLTPYLKKQAIERGLDQPGSGVGRIYRVLPAGKKVVTKPTGLDKASTDDLIAHLSDAGGWWRDTAQRLIVEKADAAAVPKLRTLATGGAKPLGRLHALWTLEGLGDRDATTLAAACGDKDAHVRSAALRLAAPLLPTSPELLTKAVALIKDADAGVRLYAAMALSPLADPKAVTATEGLLASDGSHPYVRDAILSGLGGRELEYLTALTAKDAPGKSGGDGLVANLATCIALEAKADRLGALLTLAGSQPAARQAAIIDGLIAAKGKNAKPGSLKVVGPPAGWEKTASASKKGSEVTTWITWLAPGTVVADKPTGGGGSHLDPAQKKRYDSGKLRYLGLCAACHQPTGLGLGGLAPPLAESEWVEGSEQRLARIALYGVRGPITANGVTFTTEMPPLAAALDDTAIAEILTYVRNEWGNQAAPVETATVKDIRAKDGARGAWTAEELSKLP